MKWLEHISPTINIVGGGAWQNQFIEPDRVIYDHELVLFASGRCLLDLEGRQYICEAPYWFIVPPGITHNTCVSRDKVYRHWVHFDWQSSALNGGAPMCAYAPEKPDKRLIKSAPEFVPRKIFHGRIYDVPNILQMMKRMNGICENGTPLDRIAARGILLEMLIRLIGHNKSVVGVKSKGREEILAAMLKSHLEKMPSQKIEIRSYIQELGYSYGHLCRIFKGQYGLTPLTYLNLLRLKIAAAELGKPGMGVAGAADAGGFNDPAYFSRIFKRHFGVPPKEWRLH